jgi:two-component system cell cycle sensor histidine kinase/response regulator CckA
MSAVHVFSSLEIVLCSALVAVLSFSVFFFFKQRKKLMEAVFSIGRLKRVLSSISEDYEIIATDEKDMVIYTTHPHLYHSSASFMQKISSRSRIAEIAEKLCDSIQSRERFGCMISGAGSGLQRNSNKWVVNCYAIGGLYAVIVSNVTKYIEPYERIEKTCNKLELFLDDFPFGIFYVNNLGIVIGANNTFSNMVKVHRDKLIGMSVGTLFENFDQKSISNKHATITVKPTLSPSFKALIVKAMSDSHDSLQPYIILKHQDSDPAPKQDVFENSVFSSPIPSLIVDSEGFVVAFNSSFYFTFIDGTGTDITGFVLYQGGQSNEREQIANEARDGVYLNKSALEGGKSCLNILPFVAPSQRPELKNVISDISRPSVRFVAPVDVNFMSRNMLARMFISRFDCTSVNYKSFGFVQIVDISGLKKIEQKYEQLQKLLVTAQLAGGISHDFNNLLTVIIGFCDSLLLKCSSNDSYYLDIVQIKQSANIAADLIKQLRLLSASQQLESSVLSVSDVMSGLVPLLERLLARDEIGLMISISKNTWNIRTNSSQIGQLIANLVMNAGESMEKGGVVTVQVKNFYSEVPIKCVFGECAPGEYVDIDVSDTGVGIPEDEIESIFDPFSFVIGKFSANGWGLGLSGVCAVVKQVCGGIIVNSVVGKGTSFRILIPRCIGDDEDLPLSIPSRVAGNTEIIAPDNLGKILVVENNEPVRTFISNTLRNIGHEVIDVGNASYAYEKLRGDSFNLLITDVRALLVDDSRALRDILNEPNSRFETLFISGHSEDFFKSRFPRKSVLNFLQKPFSSNDLTSKVSSLIRSSNLHSEF